MAESSKITLVDTKTEPTLLIFVKVQFFQGSGCETEQAFSGTQTYSLNIKTQASLLNINGLSAPT